MRKNNEEEELWIAMENVLHGMKIPAVMDLKMGTRYAVVNVCTYACMHMGVCVCVCPYIYIYIYYNVILVHTHIHTHTHTSFMKTANVILVYIYTYIKII